MKSQLSSFLMFFSLLCLTSSAQNQASKWYFGSNAGLNFMTNPPTVITNAAMSAFEGCASIADASGNVLFYTDGVTVYNAGNAVMAGGNGLLGSSSSSQSGVIIQRPGSNSIYYVFTTGAMNGPLNYSTVDMTLSVGLGSVTVLNTQLFASTSEQLTSVRHCNGVDVWAISHDMTTNSFRVFLITSAGVNPVPIISSVGSIYSDGRGYLKASPNGRKLGAGIYGVNNFEIYDFDPATGIVSNQLILANHSSPYGVEFSPDGSKFFGTSEDFPNTLFQWDLCAGSNQAIVASQYTMATAQGAPLFALQSAINGKIYVSRLGANSLGVINNPNVYGPGCNFVNSGQSIAPNTGNLGLPNFITSFFKAPSTPFTYTALGCQTTSFTAPPNLAVVSCVGNPISTAILWNFGDPASGAANTSTLQNPTHTYSAQGSYTPQLIVYNQCSSDTVKVPVTIIGSPPSLSVAGVFNICKGQAKTFTVTGANTYSWSSGSTNSTTALSPTATTVYNVSGTNTASGCSSARSFTIVVSKCTGIDEADNHSADLASMYPNPVSNKLTIDAKKDLKLEIYNSLGAIVHTVQLQAGKNFVDMTAFQSGIYTVKTSNGPSVTVTRLIKEE